MTDKITTPVPPDLLDPSPPVILAGDWNDDDAEVYQDDFAHADQTAQKRTGIPHPVPKIKPATRILGRQVLVGSSADPIMLFPADPNRIALTVQVQGASSIGTIASSKSDCYNGPNIVVTAGVSSFQMDGHTGALWAYSTSATPVFISALAVTS